MSRKRRAFDEVGPFGNPDGSRADIEDVVSEFVDFGGNLAYGDLATRPSDSKVRVIVGTMGRFPLFMSTGWKILQSATVIGGQ